jgi:sialate O-acetylesterase
MAKFMPAMKLLISLAAALVPQLGAGGKPPPPPPPPSFGFSPVLGDYMVLQQSPAAAAVYGVAPESATAVTVTVVSEGKSSYDVVAKVGKDATHQPNGYVDPKTGANLPVQNFTWKAVLHPTAAGGDYTVTAKCTGCTGVSTATLAHATFGDMWYCSGQSNSESTTRRCCLARLD